MYRVPFVDSHNDRISLWHSLYGFRLPEFFLFACEENV